MTGTAIRTTVGPKFFEFFAWKLGKGVTPHGPFSHSPDYPAGTDRHDVSFTAVVVPADASHHPGIHEGSTKSQKISRVEVLARTASTVPSASEETLDTDWPANVWQRYANGGLLVSVGRSMMGATRRDYALLRRGYGQSGLGV